MLLEIDSCRNVLKMFHLKSSYSATADRETESYLCNWYEKSWYNEARIPQQMVRDKNSVGYMGDRQRENQAEKCDLLIPG